MLSSSINKTTSCPNGALQHQKQWEGVKIVSQMLVYIFKRVFCDFVWEIDCKNIFFSIMQKSARIGFYKSVFNLYKTFL